MITMKNACGMSQITTTFHRVQIFQRNLALRYFLSKILLTIQRILIPLPFQTVPQLLWVQHDGLLPPLRNPTRLAPLRRHKQQRYSLQLLCLRKCSRVPHRDESPSQSDPRLDWLLRHMCGLGGNIYHRRVLDNARAVQYETTYCDLCLPASLYGRETCQR